MKATVKKWGNSAAIRIPYRVLEAASLSIEEEVHIREEQGRIVIEPIQPPKYDLDSLLKGITARNQHQAIDFGEPQGKEVW
ncbi:MAG: antitoxin MazE [Nitrospirales bacterium]|nr:MAG: antitoxin MazE [Nitrospirales bacterium]